MIRTRPPAVAGCFYPADPAELACTVDGLLAAVPMTGGAAPSSPPTGLIAPHAGYAFSGPVAATAYARLLPWRDEITRVILLGPVHHVATRGLVLSSADGFATPLGVVPIDRAVTDRLLERADALIDDRAHAPEHSIEVHLPFLQRALGDGWSMVPVLAADVSPGDIADAIEPFWGAPGTLCVVSTDLSHYHRLSTARRLDRATAAAVTATSWESLRSDDACGIVALRGVLELARRHHGRVQQLDLCTSADTSGSPDRVVGYGSFLVSSAAPKVPRPSSTS